MMVTVDPTLVKMFTAEEARTATMAAETKSIKAVLQYISDRIMEETAEGNYDTPAIDWSELTVPQQNYVRAFLTAKGYKMQYTTAKIIVLWDNN